MESRANTGGYDLIYAHQYFCSIQTKSPKVSEIIAALEDKILTQLKQPIPTPTNHDDIPF